jgi:hypothetical protein
MRVGRASRVASTAYLVGERAAARRHLDEIAGMTRVSVINQGFLHNDQGFRHKDQGFRYF